MKTPAIKIALYLVPVLIVVLFVALMEFVPHALALQAREDGPIEALTALCFAAAGAAFVYAALKAPMLRDPQVPWARAMTVCWAVLMVLCLGEEISWGQRILGIATPDSIAQVNTQSEINFHNIDEINNFLGGTYRWMSIYLILMGLGIPLAAMTKWGRLGFGYFHFPISPWCYSILFLGAYVYGAYYRVWFPVPDLQPPNAPTEIRELLLSIGSAFFALHAAIWPQDVYATPPGRTAPADA